nr:plant intracellular Ras-group-related LRR protein 4-like [Ipomoea batatas]
MVTGVPPHETLATTALPEGQPPPPNLPCHAGNRGTAAASRACHFMAYRDTNPLPVLVSMSAPALAVPGNNDAGLSYARVSQYGNSIIDLMLVGAITGRDYYANAIPLSFRKTWQAAAPFAVFLFCITEHFMPVPFPLLNRVKTIGGWNVPEEPEPSAEENSITVLIARNVGLRTAVSIERGLWKEIYEACMTMDFLYRGSGRAEKSTRFPGRRKGKDVPEELFKVCRNAEEYGFSFRAKRRKREALKLLNLENAHLVFDDLVQKSF